MKKKLCKVFLVFSLMLGVFSASAILFDNDVYAESTTGNRIVEEARKHIGKPYEWAGNGPNSFDCSGLVYYVHKQVGINFTRPTAATLSGMGTPVAKNNLQPGDIITFKTDSTNPSKISHVGIYIGNGNMIHAPTFGQPVQTNNINTSYWQKSYHNARRLHSDTTPEKPPVIKNTLGDWVIEKTWGELNIGVWDYYEFEHTLRWLYYDLGTKQWHEMNWGTDNWVSLQVNKGEYLVQVEVYDKNKNLINSKAMGTDGSTNSEINGTNVSREADGKFLLGASSNNPYVSFSIKLYNYNTGQWFDQYNAQWARFTPEPGVRYRVQFEIYGWNRMLDYKAFDFGG